VGSGVGARGVKCLQEWLQGGKVSAGVDVGRRSGCRSGVQGGKVGAGVDVGRRSGCRSGCRGVKWVQTWMWAEEAGAGVGAGG